MRSAPSVPPDPAQGLADAWDALQLLNALPDALLVLDPAGGAILDANPAACALYGRTLGELKEIPYPQLSREPEEEGRALAERYRNPRIALHRRRNGTFFPVEAALGFLHREGADLAIVALRDQTERFRTEEPFRKKAERLEKVAETMVDLVSQLDAEGVFQYLSPSHAAILGYRFEDLIGRVAAGYVHPEDQEAFGGLLARCLEEGGQETAELRFRHADGHWVDLECVAKPLREGGRVRGVVMGSRDVSQRKAAEAALWASEERFRTVVTASGEGIGIVDAQESWVFANPAAESIFGVEPGGLQGHNLREFLEPGGFTRVLDQTRMRLQGISSTYDLEILRPDGQVRTLSVSATPQRGIGGNLSQVFAVFRDVTESRRAEQVRSATWRIAEAALLAQDLQAFYQAMHGILRALMGADNLYVALHDPAQDLVSFPYFVDESGDLPGPRKAGRGLTEYVLRKGQSCLIRPETFGLLMERGEVERIGPQPLDWIGAPLRAEGGVIGVLAVQGYGEEHRFTEADRDILDFVSGQVAMAIERRRMESSLRESEARYRKLAEENADLLIRFQQEAETKSMLLQEVNHRVKNNLASILGMLDMEQAEAQRRGAMAPEALGELKNRIYALASVHEVLSAAQWSPLPLHELVGDLVRTSLSASPAGRQVQLELAVPEDPVWVVPSVANALALTITELTTNSLKYAFRDRERGRLRVGLYATGDRWNRVVLDFLDDGPGFPPEVLQGRRSLGLQIIGLNVKSLLKGEMRMENSGGARTLITFQPMPLARPEDRKEPE